MPAEMNIMNFLGMKKSQINSPQQSKSKTNQNSSDFISSLQKNQDNNRIRRQQNSHQQNQVQNQFKSRNKNNNNRTRGRSNNRSEEINNNREQSKDFKTEAQDNEIISKKKLKKLKKLLAKVQDSDKLSDKDLEALLTNLSKILETLNQQLSQDMINQDQLKNLVKSITANQEQLQNLMNNFNSKQSDKFKSLLKELNTIQEKLLLEQTQQSNQAKAQAELKSKLQNTTQELQKLLQETNAKVINSKSDSKASQNLANQKILSQFNLVKPKDKQTKQSKQSKSPTIDLKKLGEKLGQQLIKQEAAKDINSDKQIIDFKTIKNKNNANMDLSNLSNFKLGQFNTDAKVFSQAVATKSRAAKTVKFQNILNQMNNKINFNAVKQGNKITMQLEPEFLGKIQMKIGVENGSVTAKILAENNGVKDLLNGNLTKLKTTLEQKGIEIDQFDVSVGYQEEELAEQNQSQQDFLFKQQQEKNRLKNFSLKSEDGQLSTEGVQSEEDETQVIDDQVDYRA
ncbi:flagellar hook-length control protein FliK [Halanaerobacter jeridensis]|uniref:Flagellar hook-length control protein FliK n=1 Tax=Halanaerobacter jeridensis TaxID=706427 RepID=A0A938XNE9_9FIRM|nr:flagellar hook-length control protein FliK [Halanaerobacter jeridensis]